MIDLHSHTTESDGSLTPQELIAEAARVKLEALAITDHDTFAGYDTAVPHAARAGLELVCGIELATKYRARSVHLLAYFLSHPPSPEFRDWIVSLQVERRKRNGELIDKLNAAGMPLTLEELTVRGRKLIARPHFAALMVAKGYVRSTEEAFDKYLDEAGCCYVPLDASEFAEAVAHIHAGGGMAVLPHPNRIRASAAEFESYVNEMHGMGLGGIEVYHSDHSPAQTAQYLALARKFGLKISGGSDFHGAPKPRVALGTGIGGNLNVPYRILEELRG
jgi:3',5'-nucleoside bisphosphate phosphatase